jgi:hypothetical protein
MVKKKTNTMRSKSKLRAPSTFDDFKSAALLVSVTINLAVFVAWLTLRVTTEYDEQVFSMLFIR